MGCPTPYVELDRAAWARLRQNQPLNLTAEDVARLRGLDDPIDLTEIEEVYLPLSRLLTFYVEAIGRLHAVTGDFLGERQHRTPFVIDELERQLVRSFLSCTILTPPPFLSLPNSSSSASGFLMFSWITRASGRAPKARHSPCSASQSRGFGRQVDGHVAVGQLRFELQDELLDHAGR